MIYYVDMDIIKEFSYNDYKVMLIFSDNSFFVDVSLNNSTIFTRCYKSKYSALRSYNSWIVKISLVNI